MFSFQIFKCSSLSYFRNAIKRAPQFPRHSNICMKHDWSRWLNIKPGPQPIKPHEESYKSLFRVFLERPNKAPIPHWSGSVLVRGSDGSTFWQPESPDSGHNPEWHVPFWAACSIVSCAQLHLRAHISCRRSITPKTDHPGPVRTSLIS